MQYKFIYSTIRGLCKNWVSDLGVITSFNAENLFDKKYDTQAALRLYKNYFKNIAKRLRWVDIIALGLDNTFYQYKMSIKKPEKGLMLINRQQFDSSNFIYIGIAFDKNLIGHSENFIVSDNLDSAINSLLCYDDMVFCDILKISTAYNCPANKMENIPIGIADELESMKNNSPESIYKKYMDNIIGEVLTFDREKILIRSRSAHPLGGPTYQHFMDPNIREKMFDHNSPIYFDPYMITEF